MKYIPGMDEGYANSLKNKLFGLLCEYEKGREWEKFLDSIIIELYGFEPEERTIFDCMSLLSKYGEVEDGIL